jgi:hypothetical protein
VFWGEIAPCDHVVQIYESDEVFLNLLTGFVRNGVDAGDCVIVIATAEHIKSVESSLASSNYNVSQLISNNRYIPLDAEVSLSKFMINDWPDENLFNEFVSDAISEPHGQGKQIRAFGEMVAVLWAKGQVGATVRLEQLWNKFCETQAFCLFCAYPKSGFTQDASESVMHICGAHSKMIKGFGSSESEILYQDVAVVGGMTY